MKFMITHFEPLKSSNGQKFEFLKIQDGGRPTLGHVRRSTYSKRLSTGQHRYGAMRMLIEVYYMGVHILAPSGDYD